MATRVCSCLSIALEGFSLSGFVVVIDWVWIIQLGVVIWVVTLSYKQYQLMCNLSLVSQFSNHAIARGVGTTAVVHLGQVDLGEETMSRHLD